MNNRPNFILDFETLSTDTSNCAAIDCAYTLFEWERFTENPYTFEELIDTIKHTKLDVEDQVKNYGYKITKSTLNWWKDQDKEVRDKIKPSSSDVTIDIFIDSILDMVKDKKVKYWWSRSNTFDPIILYRMATDLNKISDINTYLPYYGIRDIRTFIDAKFSFQNKTNGFIPMEDGDKWSRLFKQHNSIHDVAADILRLQVLTRFEHDLPSVE